jgi:hypothetical protein
LFGSISENKEIIGSNNFNSGIQNEVVNKYEYDVLQRLTKTDRLENNLNVVNNLSYNSIGNILSSDSTEYSYTGADYQNPHAPSIIGSTQMIYDLNGNILSDGKNQYEWNVKNTLRKVANDKSVTEYVYDIAGERIKEVVKVKSNNSTSTFAMNTGTENYIVEDVFTDFGNLGTTTNSNLFMSKTAYDEIKNVFGVATVTKQDINNLFLPINSTRFVSETCASIIFSQKETCERDNVLKVVYAKYKKEKNVEISYGTLEEIWLVYKNKLRIDGEVYLNKKIEKSLSYLDPNFKFYFAQQNYISDYAGQPWCTVYENPNNNYVCNFIFTKDLISKSENYDIQNAWFTFVSQNSVGASTTKVSNILNIDLASSTKFATSSSQDFSYATASGTTKVYNYNLYKVDISKILNAWTNSTSSHIGFSIRNQPVVASNQYYNIFGPSTAHWTEELLPKIILEYKFTGEFKNFNATTTKVVSNDNVDNYYNSFISNTKAQEIKKVTEIYISENSYLELEKNKLNSQNKVEALFALAIEGNKYVKDTCKLPANVNDTNCQKREAIKFVASYLFTKHNIKLSANTLEEMYKVYLGDLKISRNIEVYEKVFEEKTKKETSGFLNTSGCSMYYGHYINYPQPENYNWVKNYVISCGNIYTQDINTKDLADATKKYYLVFETESTNGKGEMDLNINFTTSWYVSGAKATNVVAGSGNSKFEVDVTDAFITQTNYLKSWAVNPNQNIWSGFSATPNTTNPKDLSGNVKIKSAKLVSGVKVYKYKINSNLSATVGDTELNSKVYGAIETADKNLLGAVYKQKKLASLFGSEKLISRDSFAELLLFGFGYSDLIIKDMLIDVSFSPYTSCENISDETSKRNCRKEKFVKYLFAIVKYEYDRELSAKALDELFEVSEGNLSIPNNVDDYKIRNTQVFTLNSTENTHVLAGYYSYEVDGSGYAQYRTGCQSGFSRPGQLNLDNVCDISFSVPVDLAARKNEIESATITLLGTQGRGDYNTPGVFNPGQVYIYPVVSNNAFSYFSGNIPATALYAWNTNPDTVSSKENIKLGENTEVNVTNIVSGIAKGEIINFGLRIISTGLNINYTNAGKYQLNVKFAKDADQNDGKYLR